jgi:undecaprenyl-diphosphatase
MLKPLVEKASLSILWLGMNFLVTGLLLLSSKFFVSADYPIGVKSGIFVGVMQGLAVFPGVSRSGATIWAGLAAGISRDEAFRFSFILSIPAIMGAAILEVREFGLSGFAATLPEGWFFGMLAAFVSGFLSLVIMRRLITGNRWWGFSIYCICLGGISVAYSFMGA